MKCGTLEAFGLVQKIQEKRRDERTEVRRHCMSIQSSRIQFKIITKEYSSLLTSLITDSNEYINGFIMSRSATVIRTTCEYFLVQIPVSLSVSVTLSITQTAAGQPHLHALLPSSM